MIYRLRGLMEKREEMGNVNREVGTLRKKKSRDQKHRNEEFL